MLKILQKILSKISFKYAPFGINELNGAKPGVLYSQKGRIDYPMPLS